MPEKLPANDTEFEAELQKNHAIENVLINALAQNASRQELLKQKIENLKQQN